MSLSDAMDQISGGGHYGDDGRWVQTKFCFVACGPRRCNCQPPNGQHYSEMYDKTKSGVRVDSRPTPRG